MLHILFISIITSLMAVKPSPGHHKTSTVHLSNTKPAATDSSYLFAYFVGGNGGESIRFALSNDGYHYKALNHNNPVINSADVSSTGGLRDPHIMRAADGKTFYMVATDMNTTRYGWTTPDSSMVLLKSKDLLHWQSHVVNVPKLYPAFATVNRVWAPQTIYDAQKKKYMLYWSMRSGQEPDKIYYAYANKDFSSLESQPVQLFYKPDGGACIDGTIACLNGKFNLFFKTEGKGAGIKKAVSDKLTGGYVLHEPYVDQTDEDVEGADVFRLINSNDWILMYDVYRKHQYQFCKSPDLENFKVIDNEVTMDFHPRHGTVMHISAKEAEALTKQWGN